MTQNVSLTDAGRSALMCTAYEMNKHGKSRMKVSDEMIAGIVSTDGVRANNAGFRGTVFTAMVNTDLGDGELRFVVQDRYLEMDEEEFYSLNWCWE